MATPTWHAISTGNNGSAEDINQFLGTHAITYIHEGTVQVSGSNGTAVTYFDTTEVAQIWLDQPWKTTATQTSVTRVDFYWGANSAQPTFTLSLQTDNGSGSPSGTVVGAPINYIGGYGGSQIVSFPYPATLTVSTLYHWVFSDIAGPTYYQSFQGNGTVVGYAALYGSGTTQPTSWASLGATVGFDVYAGTNGPLYHTFEDAGARWTSILWTGGTNTPPTYYLESVDPFAVVRGLSYTNGVLTGVA